MEDKIIAICTATIHSEAKTMPGYIQIGEIEKFRCFKDDDKKCEDCKFSALYDLKQDNGRITIEDYMSLWNILREDNK